MHYLGEIQGAVEKKEGTYLKVFIPGDHIVNKITRYKVGNIVKTEVRIDDGRRITNEQRKKYFATLQDICECLGYDLDYMHALFKVKYCIMNGVEKISISNCSVTQARELINMLMDFSIEEGIPLRELGALRTDDIDRFLYKCLITRTCCITGRKEADIHHVDAVGMGRNRNKVSHKGLRLIALSREWHIRVHHLHSTLVLL